MAFLDASKSTEKQDKRLKMITKMLENQMNKPLILKILKPSLQVHQILLRFNRLPIIRQGTMSLLYMLCTYALYTSPKVEMG